MAAHAEIDIQGTKRNILDGRADIKLIARDIPKGKLFELFLSKDDTASTIRGQRLLAAALLAHNAKLYRSLVEVARASLDKEQQAGLLYDRASGFDKLIDLAFRKDIDRDSRNATRDWAESLDPLW